MSIQSFGAPMNVQSFGAQPRQPVGPQRQPGGAQPAWGQDTFCRGGMQGQQGPEQGGRRHHRHGGGDSLQLSGDPAQRAAAFFKKLDANGDGNVTQDEVQGFFTRRAQQAPAPFPGPSPIQAPGAPLPDFTLMADAPQDDAQDPAQDPTQDLAEDPTQLDDASDVQDDLDPALLAQLQAQLQGAAPDTNG